MSANLKIEAAETIKHLAVIMDGNGRWANMRGLPRGAGHKAGVKTVRDLLSSCEKYKISCLTLFAFSSENWRRPKKEVTTLMDLFVSTLSKELTELHKNNIRLNFIGDLSRFEPNLKAAIENSMEKTQHNDGLRLNIAVNYGGRWDIVNAAQKIAEQVKQDKLNIEDITESLFAEHLSLAKLPPPDLLIRTGGEKRISNFLIWQTAYSEFYFTDCLWPSFDTKELDKAVQWFNSRQRRFGKTPEQVNNEKKIELA